MKSHASMDQRTRDWLLLSLVPGLSSRTLLKLLSLYQSPEDILKVVVLEWRNLPLHKQAKDWLSANHSNISQALSDQLKKIDLWLEKGGTIIDWQSDRYPPLLNEIYDPPVVLYVLGRSELLLKQDVIAMVGSRKATRQGISVAETFGHQFAEKDWQVVSGLALGIDGAAHQGALNAYQQHGLASTVAVVATGLDQVYPSSHRNLHEFICDSVCVVSEYSLGVVPRANFFPRRNRIISGLSQGVVVVEASQKSGSLVSARCALEQNRDVFAVPGALNNPQAVGCHQLIQQGAKLVTSVEDVIEAFEFRMTQQGMPKAFEFEPVQQPLAIDTPKRINIPTPLTSPALARATSTRATSTKTSSTRSVPRNTPNSKSDNLNDDPILKAVGQDLCTADELIVRTGLSWSELSQKLLLLELSGELQSIQGGYCRA